jgi:DNA primase
MGIHDEDVAAVKAAVDIVQVISEYTQLRRVGQRWVGLCPFHTEKTPSFSVNANEGLWYCFGCQAKGDVIAFVMEQEHDDFPGAVERLAGRTGISLRYTDRSEGEGRKRRARLVETMAAAEEWYHQRLLSGADAGAARRYLRERGLDGAVVREFRLGWAPDAWDDLTRALKLTDDVAEGTGLARRNSRGRLNDHFRARILFPIHDDRGDTISFGGRILPGGEGPGNQGKYKNTAETPLYSKSKVLYGLDRAKAAIVTASTAVICEGYTDVMGFHRAGVPLAVATCGTALTDDHVRLLSRFSARRLVLAFDADGAGQAAAERFYRWEREHELEVAVADLPPGQDPADVAASDPARLAASVEKATPFLRFRLDRAFEAGDLTSNEGRARAAARAIAIVAEHPDELVRDQYVMDVASRCRLEPDRLRTLLEQERGRPASATRRRPADDGGGRRRGSGGERRDEAPHPADVPGTGPGHGEDAGGARVVANRPDDRPLGVPGPPRAEPAAAGGMPRGTATATGSTGARRREGPALEVLRHAVHDPAAVVDRLDERLFDDPVHRAAYLVLLAADSHDEAEATSPPDVADLLARLRVLPPDTEPRDVLVRLHTETARREIRGVQLAAQDRGGAEALRDLDFLNRVLEGLRSGQTAADSMGRLLAWLADRVDDTG